MKYIASLGTLQSNYLQIYPVTILKQEKN